MEKFIYITHPDENFENLSWVHRLHDAGVNWIQLRIKEDDFYLKYPNNHYKLYFLEVAERLITVTQELGMKLSINDQVEIVSWIDAYGCHIGLNDVAEFEKGSFNGVLGVTMNDFEDFRVYENVIPNYIGLGPYRNTSTKKNLKPILGDSGVDSFLNHLKINQINIPVFCIGNIEPNDIPKLIEKGIYGFAVSSGIFDYKHDTNRILEYTNLLK